MISELPSTESMYKAVVGRDTTFDGVFVVAVKTTGIFCRPGCGAKKPLKRNVEFFATSSAALHAGYRACKRCRPMDPDGTTPPWAARLMEQVDREPTRHLKADDLRRAGVSPAAASRFFKAKFGMTFQAYSRARRVGVAFKAIRSGRTVTAAAQQSGYASESGLREAFADLFGTPPSKADAAKALVAKWMTTPLGPMLAVACDDGLCLLEFVDRRAIEKQIKVLRRRFNSHVVPGEHAMLDRTQKELERYFAGKSNRLNIPLAAPGTDFQMRVWDALRQIPPGETRSYGQVAKEMGAPTAVRAVARSNGDNRLAIVIPCHRVIGADGSPTGYAGGIWRKEWLLNHEKQMAAK
ncbi:MAG: bifunctional transcriptional activator/DNA repair enzyme AdaA [Phycisphaerales bacterium]